MELKNYVDVDIKSSVWPHYEQDELDSVVDVLKSGKVNFWTGKLCREFEESFSKRMHADYGIALANGTLALELALRAIELKSGDEVIVPARTFVATATAVSICGGKPVIVDIDEFTQNITVNTIKPSITSKTKAIIVVHLAGFPCDMDPIISLARSKNLIVIEDCAQAHGATYMDRPVGSIGDIGVYSFCQDKIISTGGEGGMFITSNKTYFERAQSFKDHGKNYKKLEKNDTSRSTYAWVHDSVGSNYRMTEMQAAIGLLQLSKLNSWLKKRKSICDLYTKYLKLLEEKGAKIICPNEPSGYRSAFYKYVFQIIHPAITKEVRDNIIINLKHKSHKVFMGFSPDISLEVGLREYRNTENEVARITSKRCFMLLCHPTMTKEEALILIENFNQEVACHL